MAWPLVALAKLSLIAAAHHGATPLVTALLWPFVLKFSFSFRPLHESCEHVVHSLRLFLFQLAQITFDEDARGGAATTAAGGARWQRAVRLICGRINHARRAETMASGEESLAAVSMLAL